MTLHGQSESDEDKRREAVVAVSRSLHWLDHGTGAPLSGDEYDRSVWRAKVAVNTMTALGWRRDT